MAAPTTCSLCVVRQRHSRGAHRGVLVRYATLILIGIVTAIPKPNCGAVVASLTTIFVITALYNLIRVPTRVRHFAIIRGLGGLCRDVLWRVLGLGLRSKRDPETRRQRTGCCGQGDATNRACRVACPSNSDADNFYETGREKNSSWPHRLRVVIRTSNETVS